VTKQQPNVTHYTYVTPLFISAFFLFSTIYLAVLETQLYTYSIPLCSLFFILSFILFYRTKNRLKGEEKENKYSFYHCSLGIFMIAFFFFFTLTVFYMPFYHEGGNLFVWWFAPAVILSFVATITSKMQLKRESE
jgi:L-asparagine transporter-like permease